MRLQNPLGVDASVRRGQVRYFVYTYESGERVEFRVTGPSGSNGFHASITSEQTSETTLLRHELSMSLLCLLRATRTLWGTRSRSRTF